MANVECLLAQFFLTYVVGSQGRGDIRFPARKHQHVPAAVTAVTTVTQAPMAGGVREEVVGYASPEISSQQVALCSLGFLHNSTEGPLPPADIGLRCPILKMKGKQGMGDSGLSSPTVALSHGRNHRPGDHCRAVLSPGAHSPW